MAINYLGFGLGLRKEHVQEIIEEKPKDIDWFEIISENHLDRHSAACQQVAKLRADYPFVMHGVSLSIGSTDPLNTDYLSQLKQLAEWLQPELISDHICWTGFQKYNTHDLLPVPYTQESLRNMVDKIHQVQDFLGCRIALENPSTYLEFQASQIPEWEFINLVLTQADCHLLLDVNNLYVNCFNHEYDPYTYLEALPADRIAQIHMAGHENHGTHIIDTHNHPVIPEVLDLYQHTIQKIGLRNSMIEWDADIPPLAILRKELDQLRTFAHRTVEEKAAPLPVSPSTNIRQNSTPLTSLYHHMQQAIHDPITYTDVTWIKAHTALTASEQIHIYAHQYRHTLIEALRDCFPVSRKVLEEPAFNQLMAQVIANSPATSYDINQYVYDFPMAAKSRVDEFIFELLLLEVEIIKVGNLYQHESVSLETFQQLSAEDLFAANVKLVTSARVCHFEHNVYAIYQHYITENTTPIELLSLKNKPCYLLVQKEGKRVSNQVLSKHAYFFLSNLEKYTNLIEVLEACMEHHQLPVEESIAILGHFIKEQSICCN